MVRRGGRIPELRQDVATDEVREGEIGWIFDEIRNLVEPIDRSATGESHATNADTGGIGWSVSGGGQHSETG
jgi:hypothetical protein